MKTAIWILSILLFTSVAQAQQVDTAQQQADTVLPGQGWQRIDLGARAYGTISFINSQVDWISADFNDSIGIISYLLRTSDGGDHWDSIGSPRYWFDALYPDTEYERLFFVDSIHGFALDASGNLLITSDGARSWLNTGSHAPITDGFLELSPDTLFVIGRGYISRSTDGGQSWIAQSVGQGNGEFVSIAKLDSRHLIAGGSLDVFQRNTPPFDRYYLPGLFESSDAGATWHRDSSMAVIPEPGPDPNQISGSTFGASVLVALDSVTILAFGGDSLLRSTDQGKTWKGISMGSFQVGGASFINSKTGMAVSGTSIIKTTDGGLTWIPLSSPAKNDLFQIQMISDSVVFVCSTNGQIFRTTNGGLSWVRGSQSNPDSLIIQIFPQPSAGTTTLSYQLPVAQHVTITLYDVNGNLISQILSSAYQQSGLQSVSVNSSQLASGTYLFTLQSEHYAASGSISVVH